ncbi:caspase family protein, partial [Pelomonas sp. KK5]|uniref:caspase family protein n=1 Tax=Pelomonas sp. KK5 TaxID=1855730 RepID=UPI00118009C9
AAIPVLSGSVTGFVGGETQANATSGTLAFVTPATTASPAGSYAINGQGLTAQNYVFVQAAGNATALTLNTPTVTPPTDQTVASSLNNATPSPTATIASATAGLLDLTAPTGAGIASLAGLAAAVDFGPVRLSDLSMDQLAAMLEARDRYKKQLFAEAIYKLSENPALADVGGCATMKDAAAGTCLVTSELKKDAEAAPAPAPAPAAAPSAAPVPATTAALPLTRRHVRQAALPQIERKVAVIIGVDNYADSTIPTLGSAVKDAQSVGRLFESELGYEAVVIPNATKASVIAALNRVALTAGPKDSVVIYYAGHGDLVQQTGQGYWLLSDADAKKPETWLSNNDIGKLVGQIGASQVALISDSCYSGSLVDANGRIRASATPIDPNELLQRKSVVVMSSGGNEPVSDAGKQGHSPFSYNLMQQLEKLSNWQPGGNVFERVRFAVAKELPQRPQYGASSAAGHQSGGDYLFEQRQLDSTSQ